MRIAGWDRAYEGQRVADFCADFVEAYNCELQALGCSARVGLPREVCHSRSLILMSADGSEIGLIPNSVEPLELAAFAEILKRSPAARGFDRRRRHG